MQYQYNLPHSKISNSAVPYKINIGLPRPLGFAYFRYLYTFAINSNIIPHIKTKQQQLTYFIHTHYILYISHSLKDHTFIHYKQQNNILHLTKLHDMKSLSSLQTTSRDRKFTQLHTTHNLCRRYPNHCNIQTSKPYTIIPTQHPHLDQVKQSHT